MLEIKKVIMEKIEEKLNVEINNIYNLDCNIFLKHIENESVDSCVTDPPYWGVVDEEWDNQWKNIGEYKEWCEKWITEIARILKKSGSFFIFGYSYQLSHLLPIIESKGFKFRQQIVVWKGMKSAAGRVSSKLKMFPTTTEYIFYFVKDSTDYIRDLLQEKSVELNLTPKQINDYLGKASNGGGTWSTIAGLKQKNTSEIVGYTKLETPEATFSVSETFIIRTTQKSHFPRVHLLRALTHGASRGFTAAQITVNLG